MKTPPPPHPTFVSSVFSHQALITACQTGIDQTIIITDNHVGPLYAAPLTRFLNHHRITCHTITIPAGEHAKSRAMKQHIEDQMFALHCGRDTLMIALGGGVVTDLTGFVAATYCRGIPVIYIPTSLLAMVDAAIGGKTGINTAHGKNILGTFTQPKATLIDSSLLSTLPYDEYLSAFSEIIKHALIYDRTYFDFIASNIESIQTKNRTTLNHIIQRSCAIKSLIVAQDQHEKGKRAILNFGHTIAHALETVSQHRIRHGQAVAMGMLVESYIAHHIGLLPTTDYQRTTALIRALKFSLRTDLVLDKQHLRQALQSDKKTRQQIPRFVLLSGIGQVALNKGQYTHCVDDTLLTKAIDHLLTLEVDHACCHRR